jgi:hypothetical protein
MVELVKIHPRGWTEMIRKVYDLDPLLCPNCGGRMKVTRQKINDGKETEMCLSWFVGNLNGEPYFSRAGGGGGYYCEIRIYPKLNRASVIMFNRTGVSDERFLDKVDKFLLKNEVHTRNKDLW